MGATLFLAFEALGALSLITSEALDLLVLLALTVGATFALFAALLAFGSAGELLCDSLSLLFFAATFFNTRLRAGAAMLYSFHVLPK